MDGISCHIKLYRYKYYTCYLLIKFYYIDYLLNYLTRTINYLLIYKY